MSLLLYSRPFDVLSLRWGRTHEDDAYKAYVQDMAARGEHVELLQSGLVIDQRDPCLACSPDNFVRLPSGEVGLVEYKCPHKAAKDCLTPEQAAATLKSFYSVVNSKGILELKGHCSPNMNLLQFIELRMLISAVLSDFACIV